VSLLGHQWLAASLAEWMSVICNSLAQVVAVVRMWGQEADF
jgi:hypothetical protein